MTMSLTFPDGRTQDLVKIGDWDFNWQNTYYFQTPLDVPKGTVLKVVGRYDNTEDNPRNPNRPPKLVKWGEATTDEMCIGLRALTKKGQDLTKPGEKDDLIDIFRQQYEELERKEKEAGERAEKDKKDQPAKSEGQWPDRPKEGDNPDRGECRVRGMANPLSVPATVT